MSPARSFYSYTQGERRKLILLSHPIIYLISTSSRRRQQRRHSFVVLSNFFSSSLSTDTRLSISKIIKQKRNHCLLCLAGSFPETETQTSINRGGKRDRLLSDKKQKKRSNTIAIPLSRLFFTFQLNLTTLFLSQFCYI